MSANLPPLPPGSEPSLPVPADRYPVQGYDPAAYAMASAAAPAAPEATSPNAARLGAALSRYRWLIVLMTILGTGAGVAITRFVEPSYNVEASVLSTAQNPANQGAYGSGPLAQNAGWRDIFQSFAIIDPVVQQLALYLRPAKAADTLLFADFRLAQRFRPGKYALKTENGRFTLTDDIGVVHEEGTVGDSVGRVAGFLWAPPGRLLGTRKRSIEFKVVTPREASRDIINRLDVAITPNSQFIGIRLSGTATQKPAATLNSMLGRFIDVASELKKRELNAQSSTLSTQLEASQQKLQNAERALETFRVGAITEPSEAPTIVPTNPQAPGVSVTQPVLSSYFVRKMEADAVTRDREALERLMAQMKAGNSAATPEAALSINAVAKDEAALPLRQTIAELNAKELKLRADQQILQDVNPTIIDEKRDVADLRDRVLPQRLADFLSSLRAKEADLNTRVATATRELQQIPQRTIRQGELERERDIAADQYGKLRSTYAAANLAQLSAIADVKIQDTAVTPYEASSNTAPMFIGLGVLGGLALGVGLAFLLDRLDSRFRYPEQARDELGLEVLGVVPVVDQSRRQSPEKIAQIVEAFRSIRMNVRYAAGGQRSVVFGITSPGPGDGKSLVASNLALSFAEGGWRTVLIDADTRRGQLNATFDAPSTPGLVDYLEGTSLLSEVFQATRHDNLTLIACGTRHRRAPELLATPRMQQLIASLSAEFEVVIIDTPPLGAGTDAYAIGTACGQLAVVLRSDRTNLKMAKAKLSVLAQLPVVVLGAILNEVRTDTAMYQYYSYDPEYMVPEETAPALSSGGGTAVAVRED